MELSTIMYTLIKVVFLIVMVHFIKVAAEESLVDITQYSSTKSSRYDHDLKWWPLV